DVGTFGFAVGLLTVAELIPRQAHPVLGRHLGLERGHRDGEPLADYSTYLGRPLSAYVLLATLCAGAAIALYTLMLHSALHAYDRGLAFLPFLGAAAVVDTMGGWVGQGLNMMDRLVTITRIQTVGLVLTLALDLALIPAFGMEGA